MRPSESPPPLPEPAADESEAARGSRPIAPRCGECGAPLVWDPERDALACDFCGTLRAVPAAKEAIVERLLSEAGAAARGLGLALRTLACRTCGARIALAESETATTCVFCGSGAVLPVDENRNALRPESVVPLDVGLERARDGFRRWARGLWFRPLDLAEVEIGDAHGIYVPFWTFDALARSSWSAEAGYHYWVTETRWVSVNGRRVPRTVQVMHTRWEHASGRREDWYDDLALCASRGLSAELLLELGPFDLAALVPYRPEYLAGWRAEEYQLDLADAWREGGARIEARQRERCAGDVPGDVHRALDVETMLSEPRWKLVLLPIWSLRYRHGGKDWAVLVHGQSGKVVGKAPLSWAKIAVAVLCALALLGVAAALALVLA